MGWFFFNLIDKEDAVYYFLRLCSCL